MGNDGQSTHTDIQKLEMNLFLHLSPLAIFWDSFDDALHCTQKCLMCLYYTSCVVQKSRRPRRPYKHQIVNPSSPSTSASTVYNYDIRPECQFETRSLYTCTENLQSENWLLVGITPPQSFRPTMRLPPSSGRTLQHLSKQLQ